MLLASDSDWPRCEQLLLGGDHRVHRRGRHVTGLQQRVHCLGQRIVGQFRLCADQGAQRGGALGGRRTGRVPTRPPPLRLPSRRRRCCRSSAMPVAAIPTPASSSPPMHSDWFAGRAVRAQFWLDSACCSSGRTASNTGDVTSERLSLIVFWPVAAASRAADTELPGIHNAGCAPSSRRPLADEAGDDGVGAGRFDVQTTMQWSPTGPAEEL